jgi:hypothetical protein
MEEIKKIKLAIKKLRKNLEQMDPEFWESRLFILNLHLGKVQEHVAANEEFDGVTEIARQRIEQEMKNVEEIRKEVYVITGVLI